MTKSLSIIEQLDFCDEFPIVSQQGRAPSGPILASKR